MADKWLARHHSAKGRIQPLNPIGKLGQYGLTGRLVQPAPLGDFLQGAQAAEAQARGPVDGADLDAGGADGAGRAVRRPV